MREKRTAPDEVEAAVDLNVRKVLLGEHRLSTKCVSAEPDSVRVDVTGCQVRVRKRSFEHPQHASVTTSEIEDSADRIGASPVECSPYALERGRTDSEVLHQIAFE